MTTRAAAAERTRESLLDAGLAIAAEHGLSGMSVNRVVAAAGVAKGTFYVHFPDRGAFLNALHGRFHAQVAEAVGAAMDPLPPGRARLRAGMETYLDLCLRHNGVKAMLLEARSDPRLADQVTARTEVFAAQAEADLRAMGWPDAASAARLVVAMSAELSVAETTTGARDAAGRATLWRLLDRLDLGTPGAG
ncbi:TetR/AcrR family transcriptional repressor of nem operon [Streptacidiphilus sp. MAP12-33]|uniref:TetR/AcrR family transcriptional regulator n=1 Tax=Streptacidiphilus sp. MAP12-33 TaxID=3156266 RepID=UPI00351291E4